jgi:preprotein translocase subunit SecY
MAELPTGNRAGLGELMARLRFVLVAIIIYRIGTHIPVPGINPDQLAALFNQNQGTILGLANMFSGGALERMSILALGIMPYISASIIMQLMSAVTPQLEQLKKEGESGRRKISQYTRYLTVVLAIVQATGMTAGMANQGMSYNTGVVFFVIAITSLVTGDRVHDVARRADHRTRVGQRYLDDDLRRHRRRPAGGDRLSGGAGPATARSTSLVRAVRSSRLRSR